MAQAHRQDMPPKGGFPDLQIDRKYLQRGSVRGWMLLLAGGCVSAWGLLMIARSRKIFECVADRGSAWGVATHAVVAVVVRSKWEQEKIDARYSILPSLQAEEDRRCAYAAALAHLCAVRKLTRPQCA
jgi:hypothetical protein